MISCNHNYTIILNEKNEIYVCGHNADGELGLGDNNDRNEYEKVEYDFGFEQQYDLEFKFNRDDIIIL